MKTKPLISIVCPVYNEEETLPIFYERLKAVLAKLENDYMFELVFTNNCSTDKTIQLIEAIKKTDRTVRVLTFSRNFGYQASILAGLSVAKGDGIAIIDVDCEDPPEMLPDFLARFAEGYDIVYGIRGDRPEPKIITFFRRVFYRLLRVVADSDVILDMAEFSLMSARVRDHVVRNANTFPFIRGEIAYCGFPRFGIPYHRQPRIGGKTHYNLFTMLLFAFGGILTVSTFPFRLATYLLPFILLLNAIAFLAVLFMTNPSTVFSAVMIVDAASIIMLLTTLGLYIARIYKNGIARPVFIVDEKRSDL